MFTAITLLVVAAIWFKKIHSSLPKLYFLNCVLSFFSCWGAFMVHGYFDGVL